MCYQTIHSLSYNVSFSTVLQRRLSCPGFVDRMKCTADLQYCWLKGNFTSISRCAVQAVVQYTRHWHAFHFFFTSLFCGFAFTSFWSQRDPAVSTVNTTFRTWESELDGSIWRVFTSINQSCVYGPVKNMLKHTFYLCTSKYTHYLYK